MIEQRDVLRVLLADGWSPVMPGTFKMGTFILEGIHGGPGFEFAHGARGATVAGPLSSLLAVEYESAHEQAALPDGP